MIKVKLINEQVQLNNFHYVESKEYIPNLPFTIKFQIQDKETDARLIPGVSAKIVCIFQLRDGTELSKNATMLFNPDDRSMWKVEMSKTESNDIVGSNFQIILDFNGDSTLADLSDSTDLRSGMAYNVISKIQFDGEC